MKKHLIAAAVAGALAVPAMAQVSLSGRLDIGYTSFDRAGEASDFSGIDYNANTSSRITLTGSEDLGGGLKAGFNIETGLGSNSSSSPNISTSVSSVAATSLGDRAKWVELSGSFGGLRIGYQNSQAKDVFEGFDVGGANNVRGAKLGITSNEDSRNHAIQYRSPSLGGLTIKIGMMEREVGAEDDKGSGYDAGVYYKAGPINAAAQYLVEDLNAADDLEKTQSDFGLTYDMGMAKLYASYSVIDRETSATASDEEKITQIGVQIPFGSLTAAVGYTTNKMDAEDKKAYQVALNYNLSKRTSAYLIYGNQKDEPDGEASETIKQTAIGLVHKF